MAVRENIRWIDRDGQVDYWSQFYTVDRAKYFFDELMNGLVWHADEVMMFGKRLFTERKLAWVGDRSYSYSGSVKIPQPWSACLLIIKEEIERETGFIFNSCLANLYDQGKQAMGWHTDNESSLVPDAAIASLSLGGERRFALRHRTTRETHSIDLPSGSLLLMRAPLQEHWLHCIRPTKREVSPRINLTFRLMR